MIPLSYVVRPTVAPPVMLPPLMANLPHSEAAGSVEQEMINSLHSSPTCEHLGPLLRQISSSLLKRMLSRALLTHRCPRRGTTTRRSPWWSTTTRSPWTMKSTTPGIGPRSGRGRLRPWLSDCVTSGRWPLRWPRCSCLPWCVTWLLASPAKLLHSGTTIYEEET